MTYLHNNVAWGIVLWYIKNTKVFRFVVPIIRIMLQSYNDNSFIHIYLYILDSTLISFEIQTKYFVYWWLCPKLSKLASVYVSCYCHIFFILSILNHINFQQNKYVPRLIKILYLWKENPHGIKLKLKRLQLRTFYYFIKGACYFVLYWCSFMT